MVTSVLFGLLLIAPQQDQQTLQQLQQISRQLDDIKKQPGPCSAEMHRATAADVRKVPPTASATVALNITSVVSKPVEEDRKSVV